jgi:phage regulator Rha-like protein
VRGGRRTKQYAFTEHGAIMAANVLRSQRAIQMSVFVVRAFIKMREILSENKTVKTKLANLEKTLTSRMDKHEEIIAYVLQELKKLREPVALPSPKKRPIGFGKEMDNR